MGVAFNRYFSGPSMGERPEAELFLARRPEPRQSVRLDDQEEDDQRAEDHELQVRGGHDRDRDAEPPRHRVQEQRQEDDEARAEEAAHDRAEAADDDHEEELKRAVDRERRRLPRAEVDEAPQ